MREIGSFRWGLVILERKKKRSGVKEERRERKAKREGKGKKEKEKGKVSQNDQTAAQNAPV